MLRVQQLICLLATCSILSGCSMCCGIYDFDYPMFDTHYARTDPVYGRVGSIFSDPNVGPGSPAPTNTQAPDESADDASQESESLELDEQLRQPDGTFDTNTTFQSDRQPPRRYPQWR